MCVNFELPKWTVYNKGNLNFTPDGNSVVSPVGNRVTVFDLKNNRSSTLPFENQYNITAISLSPCGKLMICIGEDGGAQLINMLNGQVIQKYDFKSPVKAISFSPDGKYFAVTKGSRVLLFNAPLCKRQFNPFTLKRTLYGAYDENVSLDWSSDSRALCVGCDDMNTRVYGVEKYANLVIYSMGGHTDSIVNSFFEIDSLDVYSLSANGTLCVWECDTELDGLKPFKALLNDDDDDSEDSDEDNDESMSDSGENRATSKAKSAKRKLKEENLILKLERSNKNQVKYKRVSRHCYRSVRGEKANSARVTSASFHKKLRILVAAFEDGSFFLHEMPDFNLIHSLSIEGGGAITSTIFNNSGDWLAMGGSERGQLVVWEWQSESFAMKQQGHYDNMHSVAYSPDGLYIATGADDGKVKLWDTSSGFCFVTFTEHKSAVTGVEFIQSGKVVLTCSLDGTVRAFDTTRYRNFRTLTTPRPTQFSCLAVDTSGEIICAGGHDVFEVFVWSMKTGRLLEIMAGHEGPISSLSFNCNQTILASASWDKTVKLWDVFENKGSKETLTLGSDVLAVAFRPDGKELAASTLNCHITFWDVGTGIQTASIEGKSDLGYSRTDGDKITAKTSSKSSNAFTTITYSADGLCLLAGGNTKNICIYSLRDQILLKRFQISCNLSMDGTQEFLDRRKMTEWGNLALVDEDVDGEKKDISLPGVKRGDMSSRSWKPRVRVTSVRFSPTGREWVATTTEGILVYSLDGDLVFKPYDFGLDVTPSVVLINIEEKNYSTAIEMALRLNETEYIKRAIECVPVNQVEYLCKFIHGEYIYKLLNFIAGQIETTRHIEFYLKWSVSNIGLLSFITATVLLRYRCRFMMYVHSRIIKKNSSKIMPIIHLLQRNLTKKQEDISKLCFHNKYTINYLTTLNHLMKTRPSVDSDDSDLGSAMDSCSESDSDVDMNELMNNYESD